MNILFVSYHYWPPNFGGELLISIERFESLVQHGHKVVVLTSGSPGFSDHEIINGLEIFRSPRIHTSRIGRGLRRLLFPLWALRKINKIEFDIFHLASTGGLESITSSLGNWLVCQSAKKKGARLVYVHSLADTEKEMFSEEGFDRRLRKMYLKKMDAIVSVSPALHNSVSKYYPATSYLIPCGVRDDIFYPLSKASRKELRLTNGISENQIVISFLGSVGERKGFDLLTMVFLELIEEYPDWLLWVIGPYSRKENQNIIDNEVSYLIQMLEKKPQNFHLWGRINDRKQLATLLAISDFFVFPSRKEGMGIAPLEAMAAGTPVIISKIPGVTDLANIEGKTGLYVKVGDKESLKLAMIKLGNNAELRSEMGKAAHDRIKSEFGWEKYILEWEKLYFSLLKK